jgi:site-specific recombinase XerD
MALKLQKTSDSVSWDEGMSEYFSHIHSALERSTEDNYRVILNAFVRWCKAEGIELSNFMPRHMRRFIAWRRDECDVCASTIRADVFRAKGLFKWLYNEGLTERDPLVDYSIPRGEVPFVLTPTAAQTGILLRSIKVRYDVAANPAIRHVTKARRDFLGPRNYAFFSVLVECGCRPGEALRLCDDDIRVDRSSGDPQTYIGDLTIRKTKTDRPRLVPVRECIAALDAWIKVRDARIKKMGFPPAETIFVSEYGERLSVRAARNLMEDQCKFAGLPPFTPRGIRHYTLTQIGKKDIESARKIAGHKKIASIQVYLEMDTDDVREAHDAANPLGRAIAKPETIMVNRRSQANAKRRRLV